MSLTVEQLLATLAVDQADATVVGDRIVVIQRDPQPDEIDIDIDTHIRMLIVDLDADPYDTFPDHGFTIRVEGIVVGIFGGGTFTPSAPWTGSATVSYPPYPFVGWFVDLIQPVPGLFESEQVVDVQVDITLGPGYGHGPYGHFPYGHSPGGFGFVVEYQFTIEDLTPPILLSAQAIDPFTARLTFDDQMMVEGAGSVLALAKWGDTITRLNVDPVPGVTLTVVGVTAVPGDGTQFDLTFNWEMTQGCLYEVTVDPTVEDDSGNPMDPDGRTAQFVGFTIASVVGRRFDHWSMMIPLKNRIEDLTRDLERFSNCIKEVLGFLLYDVDRFTDQFDPDTASDAEIVAMLYDMGNPFGWIELTPLENRKLLEFLVEIYKLKGTAPGIENTVFFFLEEVVHVVAYAAEGWILGVDELGSGSIAEVLCDAGAPYNFTVPRTLTVETDGFTDVGGPEQEIDFVPADFVDPANGTASEVVSVIDAQIQSGGAYVVAAGTPAVYTMPASPFALVGGETLEIGILADNRTVNFHVDDFVVPGAAIADEVAVRVQYDLGDDVRVYVLGTNVVIETIHTGADSLITMISGDALPILGIAPGDSASGTDAERVACYSTTAGVGAWIRITGGDANDILDFDTETYGGTGGAILAPEESYALYSFDIETENQLTPEQVEVVRGIAEYLKAAHEHLIQVRPVPPLPWPDGWILGVSELDVSTELLE